MRAKVVLVVSLLAATLIFANLRPFALGTPAGGAATTSVLNSGVVPDGVREINRDGIQFKSKMPVSVVSLTTTGQPGFSSGWHTHAGPVFVTIKTGSLTVYTATCSPRTYNVGEAFVERTGEPLIARNESSGESSWITTQIIPQGAPLRIDVANGLCGVL